MGQLFTTAKYDKAVLEAAVGHSTVGSDGPAWNSILMLFSSTPAGGKDVTVADLTECVYSGYARSAALTFSAPVREADGSYSLITPSKQFLATAATPFVGDTIRGVALLDTATPPNVLAYGLLDTPVPITVPDNGFTAQLVLNHGQINALSIVEETL